MENMIEEIFTGTFDQREILDAVQTNLRPLLHGRKGAENGEEYFRKLSLCLGYHIRKVEILKSIVSTFFRHNTIRKNMDKTQISATVEGIISSETDMNKLLETAHAFYAKALFKSIDQRDASYLMACMKLIIEACLLINFIEHISNGRHRSFLSLSPDKLVEIFDKTLEKQVSHVFQGMVKSM